MPRRSTRVAIYFRVNKEDQDPEKRDWWRLGPIDDEETRVS
jgi:hypothetical protein